MVPSGSFFDVIETTFLVLFTSDTFLAEKTHEVIGFRI
jgi:hypothetical protein